CCKIATVGDKARLAGFQGNDFQGITDGSGQDVSNIGRAQQEHQHRHIREWDAEAAVLMKRLLVIRDHKSARGLHTGVLACLPKLQGSVTSAVRQLPQTDPTGNTPDYERCVPKAGEPQTLAIPTTDQPNTQTVGDEQKTTGVHIPR